MNAPVANRNFVAADLPEPGYGDLAHIPGMVKVRMPLWRTLKFLANPLGASRDLVAAHGRIFRRQDIGRWGVSLIGPEANEIVLFDRDKNFSSDLGWTPILELLFPRGLMLLDFEEHRMHRKTLSVAFKTEPMRHYFTQLQDGIARGLAPWPRGQSLKFYPAIKALTLDLAATSFLGVPWGPEAKAINKAFCDMVAASVAVIRKPLPFTAMKRGVDGRAFMSAYFAREIPLRRGREGKDIFTQVCNARDENDQLLGVQDIIDHMNFLMMAAHDTTTSSISSIVWCLAKNPQWQEQLRAEIAGIRARHGELSYETIGEMDVAERVFKEAMRLIPPVPSMPRRAIRDFTFQNHVVPAGTHVGINQMISHRLPEHWPDPEHFDADRFTPENSRGRHKYAWVPFGGGAHMCLGQHFAYMQVKLVLFALLEHHRIVAETPLGSVESDFTMFPIPKPKNGLPVRIEAL
ncbi:cytochrome P450 [Sandarakinorhabdus sp.]|uniref:cytochrome P450 n=1 Tax=Sandarakinorhabdus sp. TaxID=1916663 RepID=UPI003341D23C